MNDFNEKLCRAASSWLDARTPFLAHGCSQKHGVDCVHLAHAIYTEAGLSLPPVPGDYFMDESRHQATGKLLDYIEGSKAFKRITNAGECPAGALLCAEIGLAPYHVAVVFEQGRAIHSIRPRGVGAVSLGDPVFKKIFRAYLPK